MKFIEACGLINEGKKIRRRCWGNTDFFIIDNFSVLENDDYEAEDWEEFVEVLEDEQDG